MPGLAGWPPVGGDVRAPLPASVSPLRPAPSPFPPLAAAGLRLSLPFRGRLLSLPERDGTRLGGRLRRLQRPSGKGAGGTPLPANDRNGVRKNESRRRTTCRWKG